MVEEEDFGLFDRMEKLLSGGYFAATDALLDDTDPADIGTAPLLAVLTITLHAGNQLARRDRFLARATPVLEGRLGPDRAAKLLEHRRGSLFTSAAGEKP